MLKHPGATSEQRTAFGPAALKEESWSRLGPMGPLLDPKMYPARVGPPPEDNSMRFNQPNVFLTKVIPITSGICSYIKKFVFVIATRKISVYL